MSFSIPSRLSIVQTAVVLADPHILSDIRDRRSIIDAIYDSLLRRDDEGQFQPWLALSWQVDASGKHWRFSLRREVRCHDGGGLDAYDAVASLQRALSPDLPGELGTEGVLRSYLAGANIHATDAWTLLIDLQEALADLPDFLVDIPIVPQRAHASLPGQAMGSGPYQVEEHVSGRIVLRAFPEHWGSKASVEQLVWIAEPDAQRRLQLIQQGGADIAVDPPLDIQVHQDMDLRSRPAYLCIISMFNIFEGPCQDVRVRRALNYAIDREALIQDVAIANGTAQALAGPLTQQHFGDNTILDVYPYRPDYARHLLAEAGYTEGLRLEMDLPSRFPDESIPLARRIAEDLSRVGVQVTLRIHDNRPQYAQMIKAKQFGDLCCFDSSPASAWRVYCEKLDARRQGPWWQGYANEQVHQLLDQAARTLDLSLRIGLFKQIFKLVHDDAPWLFLYAPNYRWLGSASVSGLWQTSPEGRIRLVQTGAM